MTAQSLIQASADAAKEISRERLREDVSRRSLRPDVRNPVLLLPGVMDVLADLPPEARTALAAFLLSLRNDARARAEKSWRQNKGPMAAYWKAVGVYAEHLRRSVKRAVLVTGEPH